jgi:hypothetical protein
MGDDASAEWRTTQRAVVVDTLAVPPRALVERSSASATDSSTPDTGASDAWTLPSWTVVERREHEPDVGRIAAQARQALGFDVVLLHYVDPIDDDAARERSGTWVAEPRDREAPRAVPAGGRWVTAAEIEALPSARDGALDVVRRTLAELPPGAAPANRCLWSQPGWFSRAEAWMTRWLEAQGRPATGSVVQVRNNSISSILRAPTALGDVYLKAASHHFQTEARITTGLAVRFAEHLPVVLAADVEHSWLLMEDFGPHLRHAPAEAWEQALCLMGELQRKAIGETAWLFSIGAADRRLATLREQIPSLLDAPETRGELEPDLHARLVARAPEMQAACDALAACGVPETLIHGDLHGGNVAYRDGRITIFDWTDTAVSHPFLDLVTFLPTERRTPVALQALGTSAAAQRLRDAYLEGWTAFATRAQLERAVALLETVQQLHHAQSYLQILRSLEPADYWQWEGEMAQWLPPLAE